MPLDVRLVENKGVESHVENEEKNEAEADDEADMGAAEVGAAAAAAEEGVGGGGGVQVAAVAAAVVGVVQVVVLRVRHGLGVDGRHVLARGHWRAEALHRAGGRRVSPTVIRGLTQVCYRTKDFPRKSDVEQRKASPGNLWVH